MERRAIEGREELEARAISMFHSLDIKNQNKFLHEFVQRLPSLDLFSVVDRMVRAFNDR